MILIGNLIIQDGRVVANGVVQDVQIPRGVHGREGDVLAGLLLLGNLVGNRNLTIGTHQQVMDLVPVVPMGIEQCKWCYTS